MSTTNTPTPDPNPTFSVTSLMVYEACPFQYFYTFVLGIAPPVTRAMRTGTNIHTLIAEHFKKPQLMPPDAEPRVVDMLEEFKRSRFNLPPVEVEKSFVLPFERGGVRGRIDVVLPRPDGGLEVVDFKSGSIREREELDRSLQLPIYTMAIGERFEKEPEDLAYTYYFLRDGTEVSFAPTASGFEALGSRVANIMQAIGEGRFEPAPGCRCFACRRRGRSPRR